MRDKAVRSVPAIPVFFPLSLSRALSGAVIRGKEKEKKKKEQRTNITSGQKLKYPLFSYF